MECACGEDGRGRAKNGVAEWKLGSVSFLIQRILPFFANRLSSVFVLFVHGFRWHGEYGNGGIISHET